MHQPSGDWLKQNGLDPCKKVSPTLYLFKHLQVSMHGSVGSAQSEGPGGVLSVLVAWVFFPFWWCFDGDTITSIDDVTLCGQGCVEVYCAQHYVEWMDQPVTSQPYILNPTPYTQNPTPETLHPKPKTLNPNPQTINLRS